MGTATSLNDKPPYPTGNPGLPTGNPGLRIGNPGLRTGNPGLRTGNPGLRTGNPGLRIGNPGLRTGNPGLPTGSSGLPTGNSGLPTHKVGGGTPNNYNIKPFARPSVGQRLTERNNSNQKPLSEIKELVVIAIDFGMTYTGYAFGFQHDISKVYTSTAGGRLAEDRVPTTVLLKPDKSFHSFGHMAEDDYTELVKKGKQKDWMYFEHFKMELYTNDTIKLDTPVHDREGNEMPAIVIFTMVIRHLKDLIEKHLQPTAGSMQGKDFKWLITIPAIWSDAARQFMREAAKNAGIDDNKLHLVLEPEAAAVYCMEQAAQWQQRYFDKNQQVVEFTSGLKYILADLGGGTADICVHEIIDGDNIREIFSATGDALGGTYVNQAFIQFLQKLFGADVIHEIKQNRLQNYLDLLRDFERKKKTFCKGTKDIRFSLDPEFPKLIEKRTGEKLEQVIPEANFEGKANFNPKTNKLTINSEVVKGFFERSLMGIIKKLKDILQETNDPGLKTLILVGGYSESPYLKEVIESEFKHLLVLQEPDARLAVLKGAVTSGFKPRVIKERRARFSYGFYMIQHYDRTQHPQELRLYHDGTFYCDSIFLKQIEKGQILNFGQAFKYSSQNKVMTESAKRRPFLIRLAKSTQSDPKFCTEEEGCKTIGQITVYPPPGGWPNQTNLVLHLIVGETEFIVNVFDQSTGASFESEISFL